MHIHSSIDIRPPFRFNREYLKRVEERKEEEKERTDKYRDRAEERRKGLGDEYKDNEALLSAYKANAAAESGNVLDGESNDARKLEIEQSKFLGGDMEHTHLVKGLDYALLQKIRSEQAKRAVEPVADSGEGSSAASSTAEKSKAAATAAATFAAAAASVQEDTPLTFRTKIGRGVYNTLFNKQPAMRNELFQTGRMAYTMELDRDSHWSGSDVPTTITRSKAECPETQKMQKLTNNDIVINKLTQILSYLGKGAGKKMRKKEKGKKEKEKKKMLPVSFAAMQDADGNGEEEEEEDMYAGLNLIAKKTSNKAKKSASSSASYFKKKKKSNADGEEEGGSNAVTGQRGEGGGSTALLDVPEEDPSPGPGGGGSRAGGALGALEGPSLGPMAGPMAGPSLGAMEGPAMPGGGRGMPTMAQQTQIKRKRDHERKKFRGENVMAAAYDSEDEDDGQDIGRMETIVTEEMLTMMADTEEVADDDADDADDTKGTNGKGSAASKGEGGKGAAVAG
eukprot:gene25157-34069_t